MSIKKGQNYQSAKSALNSVKSVHSMASLFKNTKTVLNEYTVKKNSATKSTKSIPIVNNNTDVDPLKHILPHIRGDTNIAYKKYMQAVKNIPHSQAGTPKNTYKSASTLRSKKHTNKTTMEVRSGRPGCVSSHKKQRENMNYIGPLANFMDKRESKKNKQESIFYNRSMSHGTLHSKIAKENFISNKQKTLEQCINNQTLTKIQNSKTGNNTCYTSPQKIHQVLGRSNTQSRLLGANRSVRKLLGTRSNRKDNMTIVQNNNNEALTNNFSLELPDDTNFAKMVNFVEELKNTIEPGQIPFLTTKRARSKNKDETSCSPDRVLTEIRHRPPPKFNNLDTPQMDEHNRKQACIQTEKGHRYPMQNLLWRFEKNISDRKKSVGQIEYVSLAYSPKTNITMMHEAGEGDYKESQRKIAIIRNSDRPKVLLAKNIIRNSKTIDKPNEDILQSKIVQYALNIKNTVMAMKKAKKKKHHENSKKDGEISNEKLENISENEFDMNKIRKNLHVQENEQVCLVPKLKFDFFFTDSLPCVSHDISFIFPTDYLKL